MQKSWESYIDVGIVLPKLFSGIADDKERFSQGLMTILKDPFFTVVEVSYTPDPEIVEMTGEYARLAGAQVVFNGGDAVRRLGMDLSSLEEEKRKASVESGKQLIDQCYRENARIMHVVTGKYTTEEEKDYATVLAKAPHHAYSGQCTYCGHCAPCPAQIDIAMVNKLYDLAVMQKEIPASLRAHYEGLSANAEDCIGCGGCEERCPFGVPVVERMEKAKELFR